jgi:hypothetical protein
MHPCPTPTPRADMGLLSVSLIIDKSDNSISAIALKEGRSSYRLIIDAAGVKSFVTTLFYADCYVLMSEYSTSYRKYDCSTK